METVETDQNFAVEIEHLLRETRYDVLCKIDGSGTGIIVARAVTAADRAVAINYNLVVFVREVMRKKLGPAGIATPRPGGTGIEAPQFYAA